MGSKSHKRFGGGNGPRPEFSLDPSSSGAPKPPWCPFLACKHSAPVGSPIAMPGGLQQVSIQVQVLPVACWRDKCMFWAGEGDDPCCGLGAVIDVLLADDDEDDQGVTGGKSE